MKEKNKESSKLSRSTIDRLIEYAEIAYPSISAFERAHGLSNGYLKSQFKGKGSIGSHVLEKILTNSPQLNPTWLLKGIGSMFINTSLEISSDNFRQVENRPKSVSPIVSPIVSPLEKMASKIRQVETEYGYGLPPEEKKTVRRSLKVDLLQEGAQIVPVVVDTAGNAVIPVLDITAAAGWPQNISNAQWYQDKQVFSLPWPQYKIGDYVLLQVSGDSMQPTIHHGDWLFAKRLYGFQEVNPGHIHIIVTEDSVLCKRVYLPQGAESAVLQLVSDNDTYSPFNEDTASIQAIYRVQHRMTEVLHDENASVKKELRNLQEQITAINHRLNNV